MTEPAARMFPEEWERACVGPYAWEKKHALRQRAKRQQRLNALTEAGHSCADCAAFAATGPYGAYCELDTDLFSYTRTTPGALCSRWRKKP